MKRTLEVLDNLHQRIVHLRNVLEQEGTLYSDESMAAFNALRFELEDAESDAQKPLSKQMINQYWNLIDGFRYEPDETIQELLKLNNNYEQDVGVADKKLEKSLGSMGYSIYWQDNKDDKAVLQELQLQMNEFLQSYNSADPLKSVDALCKVGDAITQGLEEQKISRETAEEILKPLTEIKDNIFNTQSCNDKVSEFNKALQNALSKGGKEKDGVEKSEAAKPQSKSIVEDAAVLGQNIGNAVKNIVNGIKEADKQNIEKAVAKAEKKQQRDMTAKDIVQSQSDDKRKLPEELQQQDKVADRQNVQDNSDDAGRARIQKMKEKYGIKFHDGPVGIRLPRGVDDIMRSELGDSDVEKNFYEDVRGVIRDYNHEDIGDFRGVQTQASKNNEAQEKNVREQVLKKEKQKTEDRIKREDNVSFWDGVQAILSKHENKKENSQKTEDKNSDKVANKQDVKPRPLSHAELEDRGLARVEAFKEKYDLSIPGRKRYNQAQWEQILDQELGGTDIEDTYRNDFIRGMMESYWKDPEIRKGPGSEIPKPTIKEQIKREFEQKQNKVQKQQDVKPQFGNFNMGKPAEKDVNKQEQSPQQKPVIQKQAEQQRDMSAKDIVQSPADNKREFEEELREAQQIGMISKPVAKLYKGVYNAVEKVVNFDERLGQAVDKEHNKKVENSVEISKEKTNKFKEGVINVLNKREAERAAQASIKEKEDQDRDSKERALIKKLFMKTNND